MRPVLEQKQRYDWVDKTFQNDTLFALYQHFRLWISENKQVFKFQH